MTCSFIKLANLSSCSSVLCTGSDTAQKDDFLRVFGLIWPL